jgi:hypothetical protein
MIKVHAADIRAENIPLRVWLDELRGRAAFFLLDFRCAVYLVFNSTSSGPFFLWESGVIGRFSFEPSDET